MREGVECDAPYYCCGCGKVVSAMHPCSVGDAGRPWGQFTLAPLTMREGVECDAPFYCCGCGKALSAMRPSMVADAGR